MLLTVVIGALGENSLASVDTDTGVVGSGGASAWDAGAAVLATGLDDGTGARAAELDTEVETEEVVRCKADDRAADREATEPITDDREVVGGVEVE